MSAIVSDELELRLLRNLERAAMKMFQFSGWADGCDPDAVKAAVELEDATDDLTNYRELLRKTALVPSFETER